MASSLQIYSVTVTNSISNSAPKDGFLDWQKIEDYYATSVSSLTTANSDNSTTIKVASTTGIVEGMTIFGLGVTHGITVATVTDSTTLTASAAVTVAAGVTLKFQTVLETTPTGLTLDLCVAKRRGNVRYHEMIRQMHLISNAWVLLDTLSAPSASATAEGTSLSFKMADWRGDSAWVTADELNAGQTLTSVAAIKRCIARALTADLIKEIDIFDPTSATTAGNTTALPRAGCRIVSGFEIGPYASSIANAEAVITVGLYNF